MMTSCTLEASSGPPDHTGLEDANKQCVVCDDGSHEGVVKYKCSGCKRGWRFIFLFPSFAYEISSEMAENDIGRCICFMLIYYYLFCLSVVTI